MTELQNSPEIKPMEGPVVSGEQIPLPESESGLVEQPEILSVEKKGEAATTTPVTSSTSIKTTKAPVILEKSETVQEIEKILSEGLEGVYQNLPAAMKEQFKKKGEEAASKIERIIIKTKFTVKTILQLIYNWLKIIPGVNRLFLEQESKIKTDKILALAERNKKQKIQL